MEALLISSLILLVGLGLIVFFVKWYANFWMKILVSNKAELVIEVLASEEVPAQWRLPRLERVVKRGTPGPLAHSLERWLKRWYLYRLDRLIRSFQLSSFVNKDLKAEYLSGLREIRVEWETRQDLF